MPVKTYYDAVCETCDDPALVYAETEQDLIARIMVRGWSVYPLLCRNCARFLRTMVVAQDEQQDGRPVREPGEGSERA
jgi:hypothetical protein